MDENIREQPNYTLPGVLHFIKHEWSRFEVERANWDVERTELQAKIAFLQGERRGQENLKRDLVRRIKMLEYALKQERSKNYELMYGKKLVFSDMKPPEQEKPSKETAEVVAIAGQKDSRKILREYLNEIGYPDYVLETRLSRLRASKNLGLHPHQDLTPEGSRDLKPTPPPRADSFGKLRPELLATKDLSMPQAKSSPKDFTVGIPVSSLPNDHQEHGLQTATAGGSPNSDGSRELSAEEKEAMEAFDDILPDEDSDSSDEGSSADDEQEPGTGDTEDADPMEEESASDDFQFEAGPGNEEGMMPEKSLEPNSDGSLSLASRLKGDAKRPRQKTHSRPTRNAMKGLKDDLLGFGESEGKLAMGGKHVGEKPTQIGPMNFIDNMPVNKQELNTLGDLQWVPIDFKNDITPAPDISRKWSAKYTMRSHLDAVTCVGFHPSEPLLVTGSEDKTLKIWNMQQKSSQPRRSVLVDVEPLHTLRGHSCSVLSLAVAGDGECCYSGDSQGTIRSWRIPMEAEPYNAYNPSVHKGVLVGHTDAVWDIAVHSRSPTLLSCSSDGTCRLWNPQQDDPLLLTITAKQDLGTPTSGDFLNHDLRQLAVAYTTAQTVIFDIETGKEVQRLNSATSYDGTVGTQINKVRCHPTLPTIVTGHEDKYVRIYDSTSGKIKHEMIAHMDSVTGLAIDPNGLYLLSASHDGSLRFWNMDSFICVQEISAHRKRFDEAIFNVACHRSESMFASAGADSMTKVLVPSSD